MTDEKGLNISGLEEAMKASQVARRGAAPEPAPGPQPEVKPEPKPEQKPEPKPEAKAEPKPEDKPILKTPPKGEHVQAKDWEEARKASYERGRKDATEEFAKQRGETVPKAEHESLSKRARELEERLNAVALEQSPEFQREFSNRERAAIELAKEAVADPAKAAELEEILKLPKGAMKNQALKAFNEGLEETERSLVLQAVGEIEKTRIDRAHRLEQSHAELAARAERMTQEQQQRSAAVAEAFNGVWQTETAPNGPLDGLEPEKAQQINEFAKRIYAGTNDPVELARAAMAAAKEPIYIHDLALLHGLVAQLQAEIAKLKGAEPNPADGITGKPAPKKEVVNSSSPFSQGISGMARALGEALEAKARGQY